MNPNFEHARILFELRRYAEAEERLLAAIEDDPHFAPAHALLALARNNLRNFPGSRLAIEQALRLEPDYAFAHYILSLVLRAEGNGDESDVELGCAQEIEPEEPLYFSARADLCFCREQWWQALEWAEKGLAIDPEHRACMEQEIQALMQLELFDQADKAVHRYLQVDPNSAEGQRRKGWLEFQRNNKAAAIEAFRSGAELSPEDGAALMQMAKFAAPGSNSVSRLLKRLVDTLYLPHGIQFLLVLAPTIFYISVRVLATENRTLGFLAAAWTACTTAVFGASFILKTISYDLSLSSLRAPTPRNDGSTWARIQERIGTWFMIGLGVLCVGYIYLALVFLPFFVPYVGVTILLCLSGITGYRALRQLAIRSAYQSRGGSPLASWFVRGLALLDIRVLVVCSLTAGAIGAIFWGELEYKPKQAAPQPHLAPKRSALNDIRIDRTTGKAFDSTGKRVRVGEAFRRMFGWPPEPPDDSKPGQENETPDNADN